MVEVKDSLELAGTLFGVSAYVYLAARLITEFVYRFFGDHDARTRRHMVDQVIEELRAMRIMYERLVDRVLPQSAGGSPGGSGG